MIGRRITPGRRKEDTVERMKGWRIIPGRRKEGTVERMGGKCNEGRRNNGARNTESQSR